MSSRLPRKNQKEGLQIAEFVCKVAVNAEQGLKVPRRPEIEREVYLALSDAELLLDKIEVRVVDEGKLPSNSCVTWKVSSSFNYRIEVFGAVL